MYLEMMNIWPYQGEGNERGNELVGNNFLMANLLKAYWYINTEYTYKYTREQIKYS